MAVTVTWMGYMGAAPDWADLAANTLVFSGDVADPTVKVAVGVWQTGTHAGNGDPGADQCGANHMNNVQWIDATHFSLNGAASEVISDANLAAIECTLKIYVDCDAVSYAINNAFLYAFDGTTVTDPAVEVEVQAFERGVAAAAWTEINDYSASVGGNNSGERLALGDKVAATTHAWYVAVSAMPESAGGKGSFDLGVTFQYY